MEYRSVYVIGVQDNPVKIGITRNATRRLTQLQIGCPDQLHLFYHLRVLEHSAAEVETAVGHALAEHHRRGEWYNVSVETARETIRSVAEPINDKNADRLERSDDLLDRLSANHRVDINAKAAIHNYRRLYNDPGGKSRIENMNALILKATGTAGLAVFRMVVLEHCDLRVQLKRDPAALRRAELQLVTAINWLADFDAAMREQTLLDKILGKAA